LGPAYYIKPWRLVQGARAKKPSRRDTVGTLIFGAGTLLGIFLGIVLISLLTMAQKADKF
jgi:uncharacterized protein involved in exopolysaccharide biosynthesis